MLTQPDGTAQPDITTQPDGTAQPAVTTQPEATTEAEVTLQASITTQSDVTFTDVITRADVTTQGDVTRESDIATTPATLVASEHVIMTSEGTSTSVDLATATVESSGGLPEFGSSVETTTASTQDQPSSGVNTTGRYSTT